MERNEQNINSELQTDWFNSVTDSLLGTTTCMHRNADGRKKKKEKVTPKDLAPNHWKLIIHEIKRAVNSNYPREVVIRISHLMINSVWAAFYAGCQMTDWILNYWRLWHSKHIFPLRSLEVMDRILMKNNKGRSGSWLEIRHRISKCYMKLVAIFTYEKVNKSH